ncbi:MAG: methionyl-tRNA formyltransferase [Acholeplasmatales bacterium]|nr:methionyl-tRNA formyltransferase [Acholeplasmatales bacterium]
MRIVFMGTPSFAVPSLEDLIKNYEVVLVVTQPDKEVGRKRILTPSKVKEVALANNIEVFQPTKIREDYQRILDVNPDIIVTAAYGQIIPKILLDYPKYKCINVHASLLPKYRGGAPIHHAIINGDEYAGVTIMYMAEKMDDGDIITQDKLLINDDNTTKLTERLSILGSNLLIDTLPKIINNEIKPIKQDPSLVSFAYNITKEDEKINFNNDALMVYNQIRGLSDVPGGYAIYNDKKIKIYSSTYEYKEIDGEIGEIVDTNKRLGIKVKNGVIYPLTIQLEGKNKMSIKDFYNGMPNYFKLGEVIK